MLWSFNGTLPGVRDPVKTVQEAFDLWSRAFFPEVSPISFFRVSNGGDIAMTCRDLDGNLLGSTSGDGRAIEFDSGTTWTEDARTGLATFFNVAVHEIGHALGLLHSTSENSVMFPVASNQSVLNPEDVAAIKALYGWLPQHSLEGGTVDSPALCACGGTLALAWRGTGDDHQIWFSTSSNGIDWTPQRTIPGAASTAGPSLAWDGNRLWMAWRGTVDDQSLYWANTGDFFNANWTGVQHLDNSGSSHGPRIAVGDDEPVMVWKGVEDDHRIFHSRFQGSWDAQNELGGVGTVASPALSRDIQPGVMRMVWRGIDDDQALWTSTLSGRFWQPQQLVQWVVPGNDVAGTTAMAGPGSAGAPSLCLDGERIIAAWRGVGDDQGLWFTQFAEAQVGRAAVAEWSSQANIPGVGSSCGPSVAVFQGNIHLVWKGVGDDHAIWASRL